MNPAKIIGFLKKIKSLQTNIKQIKIEQNKLDWNKTLEVKIEMITRMIKKEWKNGFSIK